MSSKTIRIANLDHVVAWDESEQRHVYLDGGDLVFKGNEIVHVGPGYAGPVDSTIDGKRLHGDPGLRQRAQPSLLRAGQQGPDRGVRLGQARARARSTST